MKCPLCGEKMEVKDSRPDGNRVIRERKCKKCHYVKYTIEK